MATGGALPKLCKVVDGGATCPNPPVGTFAPAGTEVEDPNWNIPAPPEADEAELPAAPAFPPPKVNTPAAAPGLFSLELPKAGKDDALAGGSAPNAGGGGAPADFEPAPPNAKLADTPPATLVDDEPPNLNTSLDDGC